MLLHTSLQYPVRLLTRHLLFLSTFVFCTLFQSESLRAATAATITQQVGSAFSPSGEISKLTLSGTVTRYAGTLADAGDITLTASDDGSGSLTLQTNSLGAYVESEEPASIGRACSWQDAAGKTHTMDYSSCAVPLLWFMPSMALQSGTTNTVVADQGVSELAGIQVRLLTVTNLPPNAHGASSPAPGSPTISIGLDPVKLVPVVMEYQVHPDSNPMATVKVDVSYGDWSTEQGVQVPHSIQRRLNGALDLDIRIQSAALN